MDTTTLPVTGVDELERHLDELAAAVDADASLELNAKLFDEVELQLTDANIPPLIPRLLPRVTEVLRRYPRDPAALASMAVKLLGPLTFTQVLALASEESLVQALRSPAPSANLLAMAVLHKAARTPADAAVLALMAQLLAEFVTRWLAAPQVEVGERGSRVLGDLLDVDCELPPPLPATTALVNGFSGEITVRRSPGQGKLWRRLFHDREVYALLLALCSGEHPEVAGDTRQLSIAQGRVLRVLPRLAALNFSTVTAQQPGAELANRSSLLHFAALRMVDKDDVLMHLSLVDFYEALVSVTRVSDHTPYKVEVLRGLLREATAGDEVLREALLSLPERTVPEEADELRAWLRELMPSAAVRVGGWEGAGEAVQGR